MNEWNEQAKALETIKTNELYIQNLSVAKYFNSFSSDSDRTWSDDSIVLIDLLIIISI